MSTIVKSNDLLVFGQQSPFYRVITEPGLKDTFFRLLIDKNSKVVRKRGFETFLIANKVFPNSTFSLNENIRYGISQLLLPFTKLSVKNNIDSVLNMKPSSYIQGEISLTNELAKVLKVRHILAMVVGNEKTTFANQKGITTYITRKFNSAENQDLEISWANGFFGFNDPASLSILVVIPKQYLANLMINMNTLVVGGNTIDNNINYLEGLKAEMSIDLVKSFFAAFYTDGHRDRVNGDIASLNTIFQESGANMLTTSQDKDSISNELINKARHKLQGFKINDCENIVYESLKLYRFRSHVTINPYMFYNSFIDLPYSHVQMVFKKIPKVNFLSGGNIQTQITEPDFSNNLINMNTFFEDEQRDIAIYGLKLIRFLPFFLFNTYILGGGNYHNQARTLLSSVEQFISFLNSFKNTSILYGPFCSFVLDELTFMTSNLFKDMNSPLTVNNVSRHLVVDIISNSIMGPDNIVGEPVDGL